MRIYPTALQCDVILEDSRACVVLSGELDLVGVPKLERTITDLVECGFDDLTLDLRKLCFLDAAGLRSILRIGAATAGALQLELIAGPANVQRVFELTRTRGRRRFLAPLPAPISLAAPIG